MQLDIIRVKELATARKMTVAEVLGDKQVDGNTVDVRSEELERISDQLLVPPEMLAMALGRGQSDLDQGVKVSRSGQGYRRTVERGGHPYYTYQHLATTKVAPELMALKVTLHCEQPEHIVLNEGHDTKEIVVVLTGVVRMDWTKGAENHNVSLAAGDSVYIEPGVPHSFMAEQGPAEILAVNYGRW